MGWGTHRFEPYECVGSCTYCFFWAFRPCLLRPSKLASESRKTKAPIGKVKQKNWTMQKVKFDDRKPQMNRVQSVHPISGARIIIGALPPNRYSLDEHHRKTTDVMGVPTRMQLKPPMMA